MTRKVISRQTGQPTTPKKPPTRKPDGLRASKPDIARKVQRCPECDTTMKFSPNGGMWVCTRCAFVEPPEVEDLSYRKQASVVEADDWQLLCVTNDSNKNMSTSIYSQKRNIVVDLSRMSRGVDVDTRSGLPVYTVELEFQAMHMMKEAK